MTVNQLITLLQFAVQQVPAIGALPVQANGADINAVNWQQATRVKADAQGQPTAPVNTQTVLLE